MVEVVEPRVLGALVFPSFPEDAWVGAATEPGTREDLVGELTPDLIDALGSNGLEES